MHSPPSLALLLLLCGLAALSRGHPSLAEQPSRNAIEESADYADCLTKGSASCVKYKIFTLVDKMLASRESFTFAEGITLVKNPAALSGDGAPRSLSSDDIQKEPLESLLTSRVQRFLSSHTLKVDLKGSDLVEAVSSAGRALGDAADSFGLTESEDETGQNGETGRKKGKKAAKILLPLLLMLKLKAAALIPIALGVIALIAGKALLIGKIALLLSAIIALKKLLSQQHKQVTYEIVSHPHHSSSHEYHSGGGGGGHSDWSSGGGDIGGGGGGHGGWGRSASDLAYSAYKPVAGSSAAAVSSVASPSQS